MAFLGLFVGIDRYASPDVNWLSCARRDATALHALFTDTLRTGGTLLTDGEATRVAIEREFQRLLAADEDDVVVIAFSGHGSDTHELVTYDADLSDLAGTCISLETVVSWFKQIPARRLLCVLDCCFSGGMGAKVLHAAATPRAVDSAASLLDQMSGDGRLIFTASGATEEAWEHRRHGHGFLTYYLLEALQGAKEIRQGEKIAVYRLLEYVTQRVIDAAAQIGQPQHPTLRGQIDGELIWPVFYPGAAFAAAFPGRAATPVTADIQSLAAHGFPGHVLDGWAQAIPSLNNLQLEAINEYGLFNCEHLVVSAPTSSGKTMVAELAALKGAVERKRAIFLLPLKALVNDKQRQFSATYGPAGLRVIHATGDDTVDIADLMRGRYDLCLMTYEKFANLVLAAPHILRQVGTVVIDEVQMIADTSRGATLEFILTLLRVRRRQGIEPQVVALSAVIGDINGLERWLGARLLRRTERPVPLDEGVLMADGTFRYIDPQGQEQRLPKYIQRQRGDGKHRDWVIPLVAKLVAEGKQVIVFRETKGEARHCAEYLAKTLGLPPAKLALAALPTGDPSRASHQLREALQRGVAFHIADLTPGERSVVETHFRAPDSTLSVIAATTTLAMGVNTPASAVVIVGLDHQDQPYTVAEYKNIVGRAGRLGYAERGTSYLVATNVQEEYRYWTRYVQGSPEGLHSQFFARDTDPRSLILRVLVAARTSKVEGMSADDVVEFLENSLGAFHQRQAVAGWHYDRGSLLVALDQLESHSLVERGEGGGGYHLTELGRVAGESGLLVESMIRLIAALQPPAPSHINTATLLTAAQLTVELDDVVFPINKRSTQKEPQTWLSELRQQNVAESVLRQLFRAVAEQHKAVARAKKAVACLLWMTDKPLLEVENLLTQFGGAPGGAAGALQAVSARTCDVLPTVARVAEILHPGLELGDKVGQLMVRLEVGVPAVVSEVAAQAGRRLARADYLRLLRAGITTIIAVAGATDEALLACVEGNVDKLSELRRAIEGHGRVQATRAPRRPILPPPED